MSKKTIKVLALLLTVCMVFSLAACNKKQITAEKFVSVMEDNELPGEIVAEVPVKYAEKDVVEIAYGRLPGETSLYEVYYFRYSSKEAAAAAYKSTLEEYKVIIDSEGTTGSVDESGKGNLKRALISANWSEEDQNEGLYSVTVQVDEIVISLFAFDNTDEQIDKIDSILKDFGYYYP
jgi:hypothetical protein